MGTGLSLKSLCPYTLSSHTSWACQCIHTQAFALPSSMLYSCSNLTYCTLLRTCTAASPIHLHCAAPSRHTSLPCRHLQPGSRPYTPLSSLLALSCTLGSAGLSLSISVCRQLAAWRCSSAACRSASADVCACRLEWCFCREQQRAGGQTSRWHSRA